MPNPCNFCDARCCKQYMITVTSFDILRIIEKTIILPLLILIIVLWRLINKLKTQLKTQY